MFLHLGIDTIVPLSTVIAILDIKIANSNITGQYLNKLRKNEKVNIIDISEKNTKSIIVTEKVIYFSAISPQTLKKRSAIN